MKYPFVLGEEDNPLLPDWGKPSVFHQLAFQGQRVRLLIVFTGALTLVLSGNSCAFQGSDVRDKNFEVSFDNSLTRKKNVSTNDSMNRVVTLNLKNPMGLAGEPTGIWIADRHSRTLNKFEIATGIPLSVIQLEAIPVSVTAGTNVVVVGMDDGSIDFFNVSTGEKLFRRFVTSGDLSLQSDKTHIFVLDQEDSKVITFDLSGNRIQRTGERISTFSPGAGGMYWISDDKQVGFIKEGERYQSATTQLHEDMSTGAMVACANSLWVSVTNGLIMVSLKSLTMGPVLPAPEGPVPYLICDDDSRIIGGFQGLFLLDPAADDGLHPINVKFQSNLRGLTAVGMYIWALESGRPVVWRRPSFPVRP